jgi:phosphoribosylaminoimidazole (AIR) synthetase
VLGESLLTPTRNYVKLVLRVLAKADGAKTLVHIAAGCCIGMVAIVDSGQSPAVLKAFRAAGENPIMLGDAGARTVDSGQLNL